MAEADQQFDNFQQWVNKASSWLTRHRDYHPENFRATCADSKGRLCRNGGDFMRARDEGAFPISWLWPDQIAFLMVNNDALPTCNGHECIYEDGSGYICRHCGVDMDD